MSRKVMRILKDNLHGKLEIVGYGKENLRGVEQVVTKLSKWAKVVKIDTAKVNNARHMTVTMSRAPGFGAAFRRCQQRAKDMIREKERKAMLFKLQNSLGNQTESEDDPLFENSPVDEEKVMENVAKIQQAQQKQRNVLGCRKFAASGYESPLQ